MAGKLHLFFVLSEMLTEVIWEDFSVGAGHEEEYHIAELVVARNRSQARYLAGKADKNLSSWHIIDFPKMAVRKIGTDFSGPARIVTSDEKFSEWWAHV